MTDRDTLIDAAAKALDENSCGMIEVDGSRPCACCEDAATAVLDAVLPLIADAIEADEVLDDDLRAEVWDFFGWDQDDDDARDSVTALLARLTRHYTAAVRSLGSGQ